MSESTPGPWRLDEEQREVLALKVKRICEVPGGGIVSTGVDKANANLIAAAPQLLDALTRLANHYAGCHYHGGKRDDDTCLWCLARTTIDAATHGEAPS